MAGMVYNTVVIPDEMVVKAFKAAMEVQPKLKCCQFCVESNEPCDMCTKLGIPITRSTESDGLFALSGSIDDGLIQATLKGTPTALVSVIVAHMIENQYVEALIMEAANAFITYTEREEKKKQKEAQS